MTGKRGYRVRRFGIISKILYFFVDSPLTPLLAAGAILVGALAVFLLPREEEPQIVVPVIDVFVQMSGSTAKEVEQRVTVRPRAHIPSMVKVHVRGSQRKSSPL